MISLEKGLKKIELMGIMIYVKKVKEELTFFVIYLFIIGINSMYHRDFNYFIPIIFRYKMKSCLIIPSIIEY